jgi:hypothetical protein
LSTPLPPPLPLLDRSHTSRCESCRRRIKRCRHSYRGRSQRCKRCLRRVRRRAQAVLGVGKAPESAGSSSQYHTESEAFPQVARLCLSAAYRPVRAGLQYAYKLETSEAPSPIKKSPRYSSLAGLESIKASSWPAGTAGLAEELRPSSRCQLPEPRWRAHRLGGLR